MHKGIKESMKQRLETLIKESIGAPAEVFEEKRAAFGHYTTPVALRLGKERGVNPKELAAELSKKVGAASDIFEKVEVAGPGFINMWIKDDVVREELSHISEDETYGKNSLGDGAKVIVEFSSPNMGKEMHAGHLRNNSLGEALSRIHKANGYEVIRWNYIGDWGTQFGMLIAAWKMWGNEVDLNHEPIKKLEQLYIRFNEEIKKNPELESRGKEEFQKLEAGDSDNRDIWNRFRNASLEQIELFYRRFDIRFDEYIGESFFEEVVKVIVKRLLEKGTAKFSEGAVIIPLEQFGLPPALILKTDGTSIYLTRDIANLEHRVENYHPKKILYVVANEQTLSFQQLFAIAGLMGLDKGVDLEHVKYGLLLGKDGKKMSTRQGTSVFAASIADEAVDRVRRIVVEKNPDLNSGEQEAIAEKVGLGALKYFMLKENRLTDITFDWENILDFKGDSGPYLLYTYARFAKLVAKGGEVGEGDLGELKTEHELRLSRKLFALPDEIKRSAEDLTTNNLTTYLFELTNLANRFYEDEPILTDENSGRKNARLLLAHTTARVLRTGLDMLGIDVLETI